MGLALKMFDTLGIVTVVTAPSMIVPEKISGSKEELIRVFFILIYIWNLLES